MQHIYNRQSQSFEIDLPGEYNGTISILDLNGTVIQKSGFNRGGTISIHAKYSKKTVLVRIDAKDSAGKKVQHIFRTAIVF